MGRGAKWSKLEHLHLRPPILPMDLSLSRIHSLMSLLPRYTRRTIHIAGTNGKGSTTAFVDSILREAGSFTGRFNSPHLLTIRDSILLDGHEISPDDYQETFRSVAAANEIGNCQCTNFELQTATALLAFERAHVAVAILEVGLGGRLDATNVIPDNVVVVSGISAIDLDHQAVLGNSLKQIAKEKAAIARKGRPCVLGHQSHLEVVDAIKRSFFHISLLRSATSSSPLPQQRSPSRFVGNRLIQPSLFTEAIRFTMLNWPSLLWILSGRRHRSRMSL